MAGQTQGLWEPLYRSSYLCSQPCTFIKALHYRLLPPYLVHSCVSFRSPFSPFLTLHHPRHLAMDQKAALEANIVEACTNHELVHWKDKDYRACVSIGTNYFVKFGHPDDLRPELQTQSYIFDYARANPHPNAPRIPQVVHHFGDSRTKPPLSTGQHRLSYGSRTSHLLPTM